MSKYLIKLVQVNCINRRFSVATFLFLVLTASFLICNLCIASPPPTINKTRVVFSGRQRAINVRIGNPTENQITYKISTVIMRYDSNGKLFEPKELTEQEKINLKIVRFSPRRATIPGRKNQVIKLMLRKPESLEKGEREIRLKIEPISLRQSNDRNSKKSTDSSVNIELNVSITIPIIIQHGNLHSDITAEKVSLVKIPQFPSGSALDVTLQRSGNASIFGDVVVLYGANGSSKKTIIGNGNNVGVYLKDRQKTVRIPVQFPAGVKPSKKDVITVEFHQNLDEKRKEIVHSKNFMIN